MAAFAWACGSDSHSSAPDSGGVDAASDVSADTGPIDAGAPDAAPACTVTPCVTAIHAGGTHTCAQIADGTLRCWGSNFAGELGVGVITDAGFEGLPHTVPVTPPLGGVVAVAGGGEGQTGDFTCAVTDAGTVQCWGNDTSGELGQLGTEGGVDTNPHPNPAPVMSLSRPALDIGCGGAHACALGQKGGVACWGDNAQGQLASRDAGAFSAIPVDAPLPSPAIQVAAGQHHSCALLSDGTVWCWGEGAHGQLGRTLDGTSQDPQPAPVVGLSGVTAITAGSYHSCAIVGDGLLLCWGSNDHGQTGRGPGGAVDEPSPAIVALPAGSHVAQVSAGLLHTCAVLTDGSLWCWGADTTGAVGTGLSPDGGFATSDVLTPARVGGLGSPAAAVTSGYLHTCALLVEGKVLCWGSNQFGELGLGASEAGAPDSLPHPVPSPVAL